MMNCEELKEYLIDYIEGNLSEAMNKKVEQALPHCPECEKELIELKVVLGGMEAMPEEQPSSKLKARFEATLEEEKLFQTSTLKVEKEAPKVRKLWFQQPQWQVAAAVTIFLMGLSLGTLINNNGGSEGSEVALLRNEVQETKKLVMLSMLQGQSSSDRLQAVNYSYDISNADEKIIDALLETMQSDQNVNVRLAAVQALTRFYGEEKVKNSFITILPTEQEPIIQIALIDALVSMKETQAVPSLQKLLDEQELLEIVKNKAEEGLGELL